MLGFAYDASNLKGAAPRINDISLSWGRVDPTKAMPWFLIQMLKYIHEQYPSIN